VGRRRRWRVVASVAACALGITACGGGGDEGDGDTSATELVTPIAVAAAVVEAHGPDDGFAAVLYALDAGHTTDQLADAALAGALAPDGTVEGVAPAGVGSDLIVAPIAGFASGSADDLRYTPQQVQDVIDGKIATMATYALLGAPLGLELDDVRGAASTPSPSPDAVQRGEEMIGVLLTLMDVGYSFDQALTGWLFGESQLAIGVDASGETSTGEHARAGYTYAPCLALRDSNGDVVAPEGSGPNVLFTSPTCARAIRAGTVTFDGAEALLRNDPADDEVVDSTAPSAGDDEAPSGEVRSFSGPVDLARVGITDGQKKNEGHIDAGDDLTGTIEFYGEGQGPLSGDDGSWMCSGIRIVLPPGAVVSTGAAAYAGTAEYYVGMQDGRCAGPPEFVGPGPAPIDAAIDGSTLTMSITILDPETGDESTFEYTAPEVPA